MSNCPPQPHSADSLIIPRWIIPVRPLGRILEQHALAIHDGKISAILPLEQAEQLISAKQRIELPHHALLPGLINAHGHSAMSLFRGMADDYVLDQWLNEHIWPAEARWVSESFVRDGSSLAIAEMLRSGTTCFSDMYFFPNITAELAHDCGMRAQITCPIFDFPSIWGSGPEEYIHKALELRDSFKHSSRINVVFGPHAPYTVGDKALQQIATLAAELDIGVQMHIHETQQEVDEAVARSGLRPLQRLNQLGILNNRTQCVHMTALDDSDIALLQQCGSHVVHCPQSNLKLASGFCPTQRLRSEQINVCLGTDGAASNNSLDMFAELRIAALLAKGVSGNAAAITDWQALEMATYNGALAMGLEQQIGSLETGKCADMIAVDLSGVEYQPVYQPISQLVYTQCGQAVSHSWVDGQLLLKDRQLTGLNLAQICRDAQAWRQRIHQL